MKKTIVVSLLTGLALTGMAAPGQAEVDQLLGDFDSAPEAQLLARWGGGRGGNKQGWMDSLNLSDSQKEQLNAIRQRYQEQMRTVSEQLRTNQNELRTLMAGNANENEIRAKHNQVANLRQQLQSLRFDSMLESRQVLTPQQRQQFNELMQEQRARGAQRRGGGQNQN